MKHFSFLLLLLSGFSLQAQDRSIPSEKPKLIIGITVSEMRYDYLTRYWNKYGEGGFKRLASKGVNYRNAHHDYLLNEASSGFASISTGAYPDMHGIVSDYWYDRLRNKIVYCIDDERSSQIGGNSGLKFSPTNLQVSTLSDELKLSNLFKSKVISVSLEPEAAILSGGNTANASYWYDRTSGEWVTSSFYTDTLPPWVKEFNKKDLASVYLKQTWEPLLGMQEYIESLADDNPIEKGLKGRRVFPYDLALMSSPKKSPADRGILAYTPFGNTYTKDFAIAAIISEQLGKDNTTDWLFLNFAAMANAGESFNSWSVEMQDFYLRLDKELEHFLDFVDQEVGLKNVVIYLTANNARASEPSYLMEKRMPSGYFNYNASLSLLSSYLNIIYGSGDWVKFYYAQQIYLNRELIEDSRLNYSEFMDRAARFLIQFEGVSNVLTAENLMTNNYTRGNYERIQKTYHQKRSGDIILSLKQGWIESGAEKEYSSSFRYDSHVPLIFFGWKLGRNDVARAVSVCDLVPSISSLLDITAPSSSQGIILREIAE